METESSSPVRRWLALIGILIIVALLVTVTILTYWPGGHEPAVDPELAEIAVELSFVGASVAVTALQADAVETGDLELCVSSSVAAAALETSYSLWIEAGAEATSPDGTLQLSSVTVDLSPCLELGLPAVPDELVVDPGLLAVLEVVGDSVAAGAVPCADDCDTLDLVVPVLQATTTLMAATLAAISEEGLDPDGVVVVPLPAILLPADDDDSGDGLTNNNCDDDDDDDDDDDSGLWAGMVIAGVASSVTGYAWWLDQGRG